MILVSSLVSDAGRNIAYIRYDYNNNPMLIVFKDGHETEYVYSATGEKLRVKHITAMPNVATREIGKDITERLPEKYMVSTPETVDYLLGGALTLRNGRIDKYLFEKGYFQPRKYNYSTTYDNFDFCYYDKDHLGNIRQVTKDDKYFDDYPIATIDYYPSGAERGGIWTEPKYKYNGKEFDHMHGLNTYDYGARQYNPVTGRWDRIDPLCEKYYNVSPYNYCLNNPVMLVDPDGKDPDGWGKTLAGAEFGGWAGAKAGAAIGTAICPGWGTIIGAGIGGVVGSVAGEQLTIYMLNR